MELKSLLFNGLSWSVFPLAEEVILLECPRNTLVERVYSSTAYLQKLLQNDIYDIVTAYHSIALFTKCSLEEVVERLSNQPIKEISISGKKSIVKIPICYEEGLDMDRMIAKTGLNRKEIIERHLKGTYRAAFIGFTPGFIYADGLDSSLACSRIEKPRKHVPMGSVGIGGKQTGIYSLASPGGWNIIGRTPEKLFDKSEQPPMKIDIGTSFTFFRINQKEFESWDN